MARAATRQARRWVEPLARFGLAAKGIVYLVAGVVAARAGFLGRGRPAEKDVALNELLSLPMGSTLVGVVAFGLFAYVIWKLVEALLDPEGRGHGAKGLAWRAGALVIAALYTGLAVTVMKTFLGERGASGSKLAAARDLSGGLLELPGGRWLLGLIGVGVIGYGAWELVRAGGTRFLDGLRVGEMSAAARTWARRVGRVGLVARGTVFILMGGFVVRAAATLDPSKVRGLEGALLTLRRAPWAPWLMGGVGAGLAAYGLYMLVEARYRRIKTP